MVLPPSGYQVHARPRMGGLGLIAALALGIPPEGSAAEDDSLVAAGARLEKIASGFETVEGPVVHGEGMLYFTDIPNNHIWRLDTRTLKKDLFRENTEGANGLAFDSKGRLLMCKGAGKRLARLTPEGNEEILLQPVRERPGKDPVPVGVNDVVLDRLGGIYVTVPGNGCVMYLDPSGENARRLVTGLKGPNGLMLSPDETTLYVSEYREQRIHAFELDTSEVKAGERRLFAEVGEASDFGCDGMTVDDRGNLYCAGPHAVRVWSPEGELLETIPVPESPTNCTFAGKGSHVLYITGRQSVFRMRMKTAGVR